MSNERMQQRIELLTEEYDARFKQVGDSLREDGENLEEEYDSSIGGKVKFDIKMVEQKMVFDLPSITFGHKKIKFDLPSVTNKLKRIVWSEPKITMEDRKVGESPSVKCKKDDFGIPYSCTTTWKPIITKVPVTTMVKKEIKIEIPEISMRTQEFNIPEVKITLSRQEIIMHLPSITVTDVEVEAEYHENNIKDSEKKLSRLENGFKVELNKIVFEETTLLFEEQISDLEGHNESIKNIFDPMISDIKSNIKTVRSAGAKDEVARLEAQLTNLVSQYNTSINQISDAIEEITRERDKILSEL
jgi:methyl-accepting chemotaxis protein